MNTRVTFIRNILGLPLAVVSGLMLAVAICSCSNEAELFQGDANSLTSLADPAAPGDVPHGTVWGEWQPLDDPAAPGDVPHGTVWEEWQPLAEGFAARRRVPQRLKLPKEQRRPAATQVRSHSGRDRRPWEQLALWAYTDSPGLYSVSLDEVSTGAGIPANQLHGEASSGCLSFLNGGDAVSWYYDARQRRILFAGEHYETYYAEGNAYQLRQTRTPDPHRMKENGHVPRNSLARMPVGQPTPFRDVLHFEKETDMMFFLWLDPTNPDARYWFWDYLYGAIRPQINIPLHIPDPADYGTARIRVRLHGLTDLYPGDDHGVIAELNGFPVGSLLSWDGLNPAELVADLDQNLLHGDGDNILTLKSVYDAARSRPGQLLESIAVEYDRQPVAVNGQLWMRNSGQGNQEVTGFASDDILVIESPVFNAVLRRDARVYPIRDGEWAVSFEAKAGNDYLIAEMSSTLTPEIDAREQANLSAPGNIAHYLIITPREFAGTAQALAGHRQAHHGHVKIVWLDDIYKEFSAGRVDPFALGRFMEHVRTRWALAPSLVTLVGKGSLDRKDRMGYGDNFFPVLMAGNPWQLAPSDDRLLGFEDGVPPFSIGRLPIVSDAEGLAYVDKLLAYESQPGGDAAYRAVVVADDPDSGGDFHANADRLAAQLTKLGFAPVIKHYHPAGSVRANLIRSETWESAFISFSGHGTSRQLGNHRENFINTADAADLENTALPVFAAMTCSAGLDTFPGTRSLASALVLNPWGGAIASLAPTGFSANTDAHVLGEAFIDHLFGRHNTVGDALGEAKHQTRGRISDFMAPIYSVIGDPAVYPK